MRRLNNPIIARAGKLSRFPKQMNAGREHADVGQVTQERTKGYVSEPSARTVVAGRRHLENRDWVGGAIRPATLPRD
jgi:hypothetical protein